MRAKAAMICLCAGLFVAQESFSGELKYPTFFLTHDDTRREFGPFEYKDGAEIQVAGTAFVLRTNARENKRETGRMGRKVLVRGSMRDGGWQSTGFRVNPGDVLKISAQGTWRAPRERGESNADGYNSGGRTPGHRRSRRKYEQFRYAALIYRIGDYGTPRLVGTNGVSTNADEEGVLQVDANIIDNRQYRGGGDGELLVSIEVVSLEMNHRPALVLTAAEDNTKRFGPFEFRTGAPVLVGENQVAFTLRIAGE